MSMEKTLGGDRLGSGKKQKVELHGYERSTHNLGYKWRSTMSAGTLVPFMGEIALPGDTFDIDLDVNVMTHPTLGPLFGSYKVQLDVFICPIRLYQGKLHNNKLGIGMNMAQVKLPIMQLLATDGGIVQGTEDDYDNGQINPSCILAYLGIRGVGNRYGHQGEVKRDFNALKLLSYWDIYKNYYSNKMEEIGYVIHGGYDNVGNTVTAIDVDGNNLPEQPNTGSIWVNGWKTIRLYYSGTRPNLENVGFRANGSWYPFSEYVQISDEQVGTIDGIWIYGRTGDIQLTSWGYIKTSLVKEPTPVQFDLSNIDDMREAILDSTTYPFAFNVNQQNIAPYSYLLDNDGISTSYVNSQEGLALKTYQSDLFNNWLNTEWIDGPNGISEVTSIDTSGGSFTIDTLNLSKKVYLMLNRIAVSGGTYDDWLDAVYTHERYLRAETPIYCGGLTRELAFQEVISNSAFNNTGTEQAAQPLGTLAGRGVLTQGEKGGSITIKVDEPSYIIGIVSLTPRIDYSQGNKWDSSLQTMDDLHKPQLDEIGFQDLITEQMAWWDTTYNGSTWVQKSAGKQPAWINYMTNVNQVYGNFAIKDNEMFMTLNRRYEIDENYPANGIKDLTTYIDPRKYNNIFAQTSLDAQNFWVQINNEITARRKMSAKVMPNL